jgi:DNA repair photolyase
MGNFEIIYETRGKAREYAPLGIELYTGCSYRCKYCFVPKKLNINVENFRKNNGRVKNALSKLKRDAELLKERQDIVCKKDTRPER